MNAAHEIVQRVTMYDLFACYGYTPNRGGYICCPFHTEKTPSLRAYQEGRRFKCFGCGAGGSVIDFVMLLFGLGFREAVFKINYDFGLNLLAGRPNSIREQRRIAQAEQERQAAVKTEKMRQEARRRAYHGLLDEWIRLDCNRRDYAPKTMDEPWHPLFVESLQKLDYQAYLLDVFKAVAEWKNESRNIQKKIS